VFNELSLNNKWAWEHASSLPWFHEAEIFFSSSQEQARALNGPVKALQPKVELVAHPVGSGSSVGQRCMTMLITLS
jgi:hypothetical protein